MKLEYIINKIEEKYPLFLQYEWDNSCLNIGDRGSDVKKILLSLEVTEKTINEAIEKGVDLIISHHPFIFSKMKSITCDSQKGRLIYELIKRNISVYSMHTNLDIANEGLNDYFMNLIEAKNMSVFVVEGEDCRYDNGKAYGLGRIGYINETTVFEMANRLKSILNTKDIRVVGNIDSKVSKIAVVTGSGAEFFMQAHNEGCDLLITGDVKYHQAIDSESIGMNIIDCGHYGSEQIFSDLMYDKLKEIINNDEVEILKTELKQNPFKNI